jgi:hypothetical protein
VPRSAREERERVAAAAGKFLELQFDKSGGIRGAAIRNYLLEKSRSVALPMINTKLGCRAPDLSRSPCR